MRQNILLLDDVDDLGRSGEVVSVKPGFARNFLVPKKKGVVADKHTLRMQEKLKEERAKKAIVDRKGSEEIAKNIQGMTLSTKVKVDPDGKMYGSVSAKDVSHLFAEQGLTIEEKYIQLKKPLKELGEHEVSLKLKEDVLASVIVNIESETPLKKPTAKKEKAENKAEEPIEKEEEKGESK